MHGCPTKSQECVLITVCSVHTSGKDTTSSNSLLCYEILLSSPQNRNHYPCTRARRNDKASSIGLSSDSIHQETMSLTSSLVRCSSEEDFQSARQSLHHYLTAVVHNGCFTHFLLRSFYAILFSASSFPIICRCYGLHSIGNFQPYLPLSIHRNARDVAKKSTPQPQWMIWHDGGKGNSGCLRSLANNKKRLV